MQKLVVGTRIHTNCGSTYPDIDRFSYWCQLTLEYADYVLIATDDHLFPLLNQMCEVDAFYWTVLAPDIVNPGREEQGSFSV